MPVLVHDYLLVHRGAERSFLALCGLFPGAPVTTLLFDPVVFGQRLAGHPVRTSRLQLLGARQRTFRALLPALPYAAERLPVGGHDLVLSSSSAFAHGVRPDPAATHVCYCHTPFRYSWYEREVALGQVPALLRRPLDITLDRIQRWDRKAASRGTHYVANSELTRERIHRYWGVEAPVVHPPVELDRFHSRAPEDFVLVVCELVRHKRVELALDAARRSRTPIKIVGGGADEARLKELYGDHAEFLGRLGDSELAALYPRARALVMPNTEEFGITSVEAQASGRPVLAAAAGGATETVIDGKTGFLLPVGDVDALTEAMGDPGLDRLEPAACIANAQRFSVQAFQAGMLEQIDRARDAGS